jgi:4-hydroxy-3-methylbut-2-enyl diphosphate reductase
MANPDTKRVLLLKPRGFCAGVVRAIKVVELALDIYGQPLYVRKQIVHNASVIAELEKKGARFVDDLSDVPEGSVVIFSAHGVSPEVRALARNRNLSVIDATCPLVTKVHLEVLRFVREGNLVIVIGHPDHDEVVATAGEAPAQTRVVSSLAEADALDVANPLRVAYVTQTTLSIEDARQIVDRLKERFPHIQGPSSQDICYATQNRQQSLKSVAGTADLMLVIGSENSSNSLRLVEVAQSLRIKSHLIDDASGLDLDWLLGVQTVAITAGASAPEYLVEDLVAMLRKSGFSEVQEVGLEEDVSFQLPLELRALAPELGGSHAA